MGLEIERKYLVNLPKWEVLEKPEGEYYRQGYLSTDPFKTVRVRQTTTQGFLTIKGISVGAVRAEYEYEIPYQEAGELLDQFSTAELSKVRYKIPIDGKVWEVDEFLGDNTGLILAEIELTTEDEKYDLPEWVATEVTEDERYYNSNLTSHPYQKWNHKEK